MHVAVALLLYFSFFKLDLGIAFAIVLGSLFPDIDTPYSVLGKFNLFAYFMKHRGRTHTIPGWIIASCLAYLFMGRFVWGFAYGYGLHLLMDTLTPMGIMWLYPYSMKYYSLSPKRKVPRRTRARWSISLLV